VRIVPFIAVSLLVLMSDDAVAPGGATRAARAASGVQTAQAEAKLTIQLMTLDPGHFHAALIQREHYPNASSRVHVYAPLGQDVLDHLARIARFNQRSVDPTHWSVELHAGDDFLTRMQREKPGNVVVISGKNRGKIDQIRASVSAGVHVLADKPWIIDPEDFDALRQALDQADGAGRVAFDIMTERFEITNSLQRELVNDPAIFGQILTGSAQDPAVYMESVHHLMKVVAGVPNIRPTWFFDSSVQGDGLSDIGTHLVDLVQWTLFPERSIDVDRDLRLSSAQRWPTAIPLAEFRRVTGQKEFPAALAPSVKDGVLDDYCNSFVSYEIRGITVQLAVIWDWEAPPGAGDTHFAYYRGSRARVEVRQGRRERGRPELYVIPNAGAAAEIERALKSRINALGAAYPGIGYVTENGEFRVLIPEPSRTTHEQHFGEVARRFFSYLGRPGSLPVWEKPNMLAKYWVTTRGAKLARASPPRGFQRRAPP
jgi:predicted dehydrogenase